MGQSLSFPSPSSSQPKTTYGSGSSSDHCVVRTTTKNLPPLDPATWKQGSNKNAKEPFVQIVFLNQILPFVCEEIFEAVMLSAVCRDWRECVKFYSDEMWYNICKLTKEQYGFQQVMMTILRSDKLSWTLNACFKQREHSEFHKRKNIACPEPCLDVNTLRLLGTYPALWVAVKGKQIENVKILLENGAKIDATPTSTASDSLKSDQPLQLCFKLTQMPELMNKQNQGVRPPGPNEGETNYQIFKLLINEAAKKFNQLTLPSKNQTKVFSQACTSEVNDERLALEIYENAAFQNRIDLYGEVSYINPIFISACTAGFPTLVGKLIERAKRDARDAEIVKSGDTTTAEFREAASRIQRVKNNGFIPFSSHYESSIFKFAATLSTPFHGDGTCLTHATYLSKAKTIAQRVETANVILDHFLDDDRFLPCLIGIKPVGNSSLTSTKGSNVIHLMLTDYHQEYFPILERIFKRHGKNPDFVNVAQILNKTGNGDITRVGKTYLYLACWSDKVYENTLKMMLSHCGASLDLDYVDDSKVTARQIAEQKGFKGKVKLLDEFATKRAELFS